MKKISHTFFAENPIDLETKQYILLDFLQGIEKDFSEKKIYPALPELSDHLEVMELFSKTKDVLLSGRRSLTGINWSDMKLTYEPEIVETNLLEIESILEFAIPKIKSWKEIGVSMWNDLLNQMVWDTVGIIPSYLDEGYFIVHQDERKIFIYRYGVKKIVLGGEYHIGVTCDLMDTFDSKLKSYEMLKEQMIVKNPEIPIPMVFSIEAPNYPMEESILQAVKRIGLIKINKMKVGKE